MLHNEDFIQITIIVVLPPYNKYKKLIMENK